VWFRIREAGRGDRTIVLFADGPNGLEHHDPIFERLIEDPAWFEGIVRDLLTAS